MTTTNLERRVRVNVTGRSHEFFAVVQPGFEATAGRELSGIGVAGGTVHTGGVSFSGRLDLLYRVSALARTVSRLLMRLGNWRVEGYAVIGRRSREFPWELFLPSGSMPRWHVTVTASRCHHQGLVETELAAGVAARWQLHGLDGEGAVAGEAPQTVFVRLEHDRMTLILDASGELLAHRGGGKWIAAAPLRETLAASILAEAGVDEVEVLVDPMAGAGTFSLEAAARAAGKVPGKERFFAFERWPAFRLAAWQHLLAHLPPPELPRLCRIVCRDSDHRALTAARHNLAGAGVADRVEVSEADFFTAPSPVLPGQQGLVVINPPFGRRLDPGEIRSFYRRLGRRLLTEYADCRWAVLVPGLELEKALGIPHQRKIPFRFGGLGVALLIRRPLEG